MAGIEIVEENFSRYCKNIIAKKNYLFSKVGVYLQENNEYGGSIDVMLNHTKNFSKFKLLFRKIRSLPYNIITFFSQKIYNFILFLNESFLCFY